MLHALYTSIPYAQTHKLIKQLKAILQTKQVFLETYTYMNVA